MRRPHGFKAWLQVVRCYQKGLRRLSERLAPLDVTSAQLDVLANLYAGPEQGLTQEQLGQRLLVTKGNVSSLLDRLCQRGWVVRSPHPEDRRSNLVLLTDAGRLVAEQAVLVQSAFVADVMGDIDDQALLSLEVTLARLEERLEGTGLFTPVQEGRNGIH